jgi:hypothetical protein
VLASDRAMFDGVAAARVGCVGVLGSLSSAAEDSAARLRAALAHTSPETEVVPYVVQRVATAADAQDLECMESLLIEAARGLGQDLDLLILAQYSLTPALDALRTVSRVPVLSPAHLAAVNLRNRMEEAMA